MNKYRIVAEGEGSVGEHIDNGNVVIGKASTYDMATALEWLLTYCDEETDDNVQAIANVIGMLEQTIAQREKASALAAAKRNYAKANGIKYSQVRVSK
jgi:hypothetical protein